MRTPSSLPELLYIHLIHSKVQLYLRYELLALAAHTMFEGSEGSLSCLLRIYLRRGVGSIIDRLLMLNVQCS